MRPVSTSYEYASDGICFTSKDLAAVRLAYCPLCSPTALGMKSCITPFLSGDMKIDKHQYVTMPVSREGLRLPVRNFFVSFADGTSLSLAEPGNNAVSRIEIGQLWQTVDRCFTAQGIELRALNFVPVSAQSVELMQITMTNRAATAQTLTPTAVIPLFGRALSNKHDHEHVSSLLHRITQQVDGVLVEPTMCFNEEGHRVNDMVYFVCGRDAAGAPPVGTFPTAESFYGDSGTVFAPQAVTENRIPEVLSESARQGKEAVGALRFATVTVPPGASVVYYLVVGAARSAADAHTAVMAFTTAPGFSAAFDAMKAFWNQKANAVVFSTADPRERSWMHWVTIQPVLRRIFGCSFLPDHDYGKGGKGWRDIWQDLLSLIVIEPADVRETLINNFAGVRIDGSNATIIGSAPGEFIADRNAITRVWMDHGVWPLSTLFLYINQTGDHDILCVPQTYFRDPQQSRTYKKDLSWNAGYGNQLKTIRGDVYRGTILEHLLVQHLVQFFNVGEHNNIRLESADWNDGLDMAFARGESVAFMSFYGGNFFALADMLAAVAARGTVKTITLAREIVMLLDTISGEPVDYENSDQKRKMLFECYFPSVEPELSGETATVAVMDVVDDLRRKGAWIFSHIRQQEKIAVEEAGKKYSWFNGYYDNAGEQVEGTKAAGVRMTLTGQVFPIMSGAAEDEYIPEIVRSVKRFLEDPTLGGVRLNTDFKVKHYMQLGRAFGFAYGTKENGAFFCHMIVMYAYALYARGFAREGYEVLQSLYRLCVDTDRSKIYPGVPEYFDPQGLGMYHYLTGSASWLVLTKVIQVFGVRGDGGDLLLAPQLVREEFSKEGTASVTCSFAGKRITVVYENRSGADAGGYTIGAVTVDGKAGVVTNLPGGRVRISREAVRALPEVVTLRVVLEG